MTAADLCAPEKGARKWGRGVKRHKWEWCGSVIVNNWGDWTQVAWRSQN